MKNLGLFFVAGRETTHHVAPGASWCQGVRKNLQWDLALVEWFGRWLKEAEICSR